MLDIRPKRAHLRTGEFPCEYEVFLGEKKVGFLIPETDSDNDRMVIKCFLSSDHTTETMRLNFLPVLDHFEEEYQKHYFPGKVFLVERKVLESKQSEDAKRLHYFA